MPKAAIVVLADTESHADLGRVVNALEAVKEFKDANDDVKLIFDGAGTKWIPELSKSSHLAHPLFAAVKDRISGACQFCAGAFGVRETVQECGVPLIGEYDGHPSFRSLVSQGYHVITF
ncbi:MAG: DsrE family protein [Acidobacteria bacterium]|nr:DsrE family protein [Acidobacteriota bacterium]